MRLPNDRCLSSLYLQSGLSIHSCCGCAWQMRIDSDRDAKAEIAFDKHLCSHFPVMGNVPRRPRKLHRLPGKLGRMVLTKS